MNINDFSSQSNEFYQKGLAALKKKNYDYAIELFKEVLKIYPEFTECRHHLWTSLREKRKSLPFSLPRLVRENIKIFLLNLKIFLLLIFNKPESALYFQEKIVLLNPDSIPALHRLATLFLRQNRKENVRVAWEEIMLIDKKNIPALRNLARLYFENNEHQKAKAAAMLLLTLDRHNLEAENILKDIAALGTIEKGFDDIKPAI